MLKASKVISLEENSKNIKYTITCRHQNVVQNQIIVVRNLSFETLEKFNYLGVMVTNINDI